MVSEKDSLISSFEKQFKEIKLKLAKHEKETKALKTKVEILDTSDKQEVKFQCPDCDFKSNTQQGLKVHMKRKHTKYTEENRPNNCEMCNER